MYVNLKSFSNKNMHIHLEVICWKNKAQVPYDVLQL